MINWRISIVVSFLGGMLFSVAAITEQEIAEYHRAAMGKVCLVDTTDKKPIVWSYHPNQKTELLKCSEYIADMKVVSQRVLGYEAGKAVKEDNKFVTNGTDAVGSVQTWFGRDEIAGRALQLFLLLKESYTDPKNPTQEGRALRNQYRDGFVFYVHARSADLNELVKYFQRQDFVPRTNKPLLLLDIEDDADLEYVQPSGKDFLNTYFVVHSVHNSYEAQRFIESIKIKMREFERDVESMHPRYKENTRQYILRSLENKVGGFELKQLIPYVVVLVGSGILIANRKKIVRALREKSSMFDSILKFFDIDLGSMKSDPMLDEIKGMREDLRDVRTELHETNERQNLMFDASAELGEASGAANNRFVEQTRAIRQRRVGNPAGAAGL